MDLDELLLNRRQLEDVRIALRERIGQGLAVDGEEIRALLTYLPPPQDRPTGRVVVVDCGGTNQRAALVHLDSRQVEAGPFEEHIRDGRDQPVAADEFFDSQAALVARLNPPPGCNVGYCFSYPAQVMPNRDATLIRWTKGVHVTGVEGEPVGAALGRAMRRAGMEPGEVRVLNDTVASLLAGALTHPEYDDFVGLIVGTGTNSAGFLPLEAIPKYRGALTGKMAVNLESGNFHPPHLTAADEAVDRKSDNPGLQRLEKAVSGYYLPFVFEQCVPGLTGFDPTAGTGPLVDFRTNRPESTEGKAAARLLSRSADLTAACLAGLIDHFPGRGSVGILAEGSTFWKDPQYPGRVGETLQALLGERKFAILRANEANLMGAACAAGLPLT